VFFTCKPFVSVLMVSQKLLLCQNMIHKPKRALASQVPNNLEDVASELGKSLSEPRIFGLRTDIEEEPIAPQTRRQLPS
jgi:hypothetical protein